MQWVEDALSVFVLVQIEMSSFRARAILSFSQEVAVVGRVRVGTCSPPRVLLSMPGQGTSAGGHTEVLNLDRYFEATWVVFDFPSVSPSRRGSL